jgi:DHA2 family multidrug resistance protein
MTAESPTQPVGNRAAITVCVMLAALMQTLDTTIANIALPYMQGSVSASQDEIAWVLTSYLVAAAVVTPTTGYLAGRFGLKRLYLVCVSGFIIASMLCGFAQSLVEIVLSRVLQGMFGAALVPLAQSVMITISPPERRGSAMALFSMALLVGPVLGPIIGGWITANYNWRFIFFINLPIGLLALFGMMIFLKDTARVAAKLDWFGFGALGVAIAAFQILLDRGEELDWFGSGEIVIEAIVAASALYLFLVHTFTARAPFVRPSLFRNRNYAAGALFGVIIGLTYYASLALQPPYLQNLMGYPIVTAGLVLGPRGVGTIGALAIVGRLVGRVDTRILLAVGLGLTAWAFWVMTGWTPDVSQGTVIGIGVVQGIGLGFLTVPVNVATLSSLSAEVRAEGAGFSTLLRNMGSSAGISIVNSLLTRNTQVNHSEIASHVTSINRAFENPAIAQFWNPVTAAGRAALDAVITQQAQIIAYIDDYKLLMIATLAAAPLLIVFTKPSRDVAPDHTQATE